MERIINKKSNISIFHGDLPDSNFERLCRTPILACDIETSGLDWKNDRIGTCQLLAPEDSIIIVQLNDRIPQNLCSLIPNPSVKKVFHHAMFDLRFMSYHWKVCPENIACTKIAAKLLNVDGENKNSLQSLLKQYLNVEINKEERLSNWLSSSLTDEQISYAATDVAYLLPLLAILEEQLRVKDLYELAVHCFRHIPTRVQLDIYGYNDIYGY